MLKENKKSRTLVNIIGVPFLLFIIWKGSFWFTVPISLLILLSTLELLSLSKIQQAEPIPYLLPVGIILLILNITSIISIDKISILILICLLTLIIEIFRDKKKPLLNITIINFGMIWLGLMFSSLITLRLIPDYGLVTTIFIFLSVWVCDTFAFVFGSKFGKNKIVPLVSPNKSWEGSIAGFLGSFILMLLFYYNNLFESRLNFFDLLCLSIITGMLSQLGDFAESLFKREAGVKDTSDYLQGHGGVLDRFDSMIIAAPLTLLYLQYIKNF